MCPVKIVFVSLPLWGVCLPGPSRAVNVIQGQWAGGESTQREPEGLPWPLAVLWVYIPAGQKQVAPWGAWQVGGGYTGQKKLHSA